MHGLFDDFGNGDVAVFSGRRVFFDARHHVARDGSIGTQALGFAKRVGERGGGADFRGVDGIEEFEDLAEFLRESGQVSFADFELGKCGCFCDGCGVQLTHGG